MNHKLESQLKKYYRNIKREIPNDYSGKKDIIDNIRQNIEDFLAEQPEATFADVLSQFGNASEIAASFIDDMSTEEIAALLKKDRRKRRCSWIVCAITLSLVGGLCYYMYRIYMDTPVEITETTTIYYYENTETTELPLMEENEEQKGK